MTTHLLSRRSLLAATLTALTAAAPPALAQPYPAKPIVFIVPFAAGGTVDVVARAIAQAMSPRLGQPVTVENVPGAGANIGAARVAAADSTARN